MRIVEGSCEVPLGAWARPSDDDTSVIVLDAFLWPDVGCDRPRQRARDRPGASSGAEAARMLL